MTKEERREYNKAYKDKPENKAKAKANSEKPENKAKKKAYREENKAKIKAYDKANRDKPENKAKRQTPEGIKYDKIKGWKSGKIISNDWDATYDWVMNTKNCQKCNVLLENGTGSKGKCLDHDHSITDGPNARAVLCWSCNINEGKKRHASKEDRDKYYKEQIKCDCGADVLRQCMNQHKKSRKHIDFHINLNS